MQEETWKPVVGYEGLYECSSHGRVRSVGGNKGQHRKPHILHQQKNHKGYMMVKLSKNDVKKDFSVHRIIASAFLENPENKPQVHHKDGVRNNNIVSNLEWVTASENNWKKYH